MPVCQYRAVDNPNEFRNIETQVTNSKVPNPRINFAGFSKDTYLCLCNAQGVAD